MSAPNSQAWMNLFRKGASKKVSKTQAEEWANAAKEAMAQKKSSSVVAEPEDFDFTEKPVNKMRSRMLRRLNFGNKSKYAVPWRTRRKVIQPSPLNPLRRTFKNKVPNVKKNNGGSAVNGI